MSAPERREPQSEPTRDSRPPSVAPLRPLHPSRRRFPLHARYTPEFPRRHHPLPALTSTATITTTTHGKRRSVSLSLSFPLSTISVPISRALPPSSSLSRRGVRLFGPSHSPYPRFPASLPHGTARLPKLTLTVSSLVRHSRTPPPLSLTRPPPPSRLNPL